jgi:poly(hydroxyalkanoate) depolymerase family esterase
MDIRRTLGNLSAHQDNWEKLITATARFKSAGADQGASSTHLREIQNFGSNPGALRMFAYLPPQPPPHCALVVVLHGCGQSAAGYDHGAGWSTLAERFGFALLLPEQQPANNPNGCFNWFQPDDFKRGSGEAASIRQMVEKMVADHGIDPNRVFVTGLSAGGAMASIMLATYPDVFAGGAIIAGLPYGAANNVQQAFERMLQSPPRSAHAWGDLVRSASPHAGPWPRVSVWHGGADTMVIPANAGEILKQWTDVHGLRQTPSHRAVVDGFPRQVWVNEAGDELIESYTIPQMAHGTPLATGEADDQCGAAGPFHIEAGISSSYHIAKFFGLTDAEPGYVASTKKQISIAADRQQVGRDRREQIAIPSPDPQSLAGETSDRDIDAPQGHIRVPRSSAVDVAAVITKALKAAGLMKD